MFVRCAILGADYLFSCANNDIINTRHFRDAVEFIGERRCVNANATRTIARSITRPRIDRIQRALRSDEKEREEEERERARWEDGNTFVMFVMSIAIKITCHSCIRNAQRYAIITDVVSNDPCSCARRRQERANPIVTAAKPVRTMDRTRFEQDSPPIAVALIRPAISAELVEPESG